jgi:plastocyanin
MRDWKLSVIATVAASVLLLGACAGKNATGAAAGPGTTTPPATTTSSSPSPTAAAYGSGTGRYGSGGGYGSGGATAAGSTTGTASATVKLSNFSFGPSKVSVKHGATIALDNVATATPHSFVIDGQNIDVVIAPGTTSDLKIGLAPGTYHFYCKFHKQLGMTGTITVG